MTIGTGIVWSTVLALLAVAIYQISIRKKWKVLGRAVGLLVLVVVLLTGAIWAWSSYKNRPAPVTELSSVRLGMSPVEVKLAKGSPSNDSDAKVERDSDQFKLTWLFREDGLRDRLTLVLFFGPTADSLRADIVCTKGGYETLLGLGQYNTEQDITDKLGQPTGVSINSEGLSKLVSFSPLNVAYELTRGQISDMCISQSGAVVYANEYGATGPDRK